MKKALLAGIALALLSTAASAADLPRAYKAPAPMPYTQQVFSWTGGYIGVQGGYGWSSEFVTSAVGVPFAGIANTGLSPEGGFFGGTLGYNWQIPNSMFVLGIEGDASLADLSDSRTIVPGVVSLGASSKLDKFGTVRGRLGIAVDRTLFYGTGGLAVGYNIGTVDIGLPGASTRLFDAQTHVGWTAGAGIEYALSNNWTAKVEYKYVDFESKTYNFVPGLLPGIAVDPKFHTVSAGINYKLGY